MSVSLRVNTLDVEERVGSTPTTARVDKQYIWGPQYVDDLVVGYRDAVDEDGELDEELYALHDANYNVTAITDNTGAVVEPFSYTPYGESTELDPDFTSYTGSNYDWGYRYTTRELDLDTGLQLNRNRWYHPQLGRWLSRDPIKYLGGMNLYGYVGGMPTYHVDPEGLKEPPGFWELYWHYDEWENRGPISKTCVVAGYAGGAGAIGTACVKKCIKKEVKKQIKKRWRPRYKNRPLPKDWGDWRK